MAKKVRSVGRLPKYPWDKWFAHKRKFVLTKGKDFDCEVNNMAVYFRNVAKQYQIIPHLSIKGETITVELERKPNA